jgi:putative ABC transport system ATP-binding protein
VTHEPDIAHYSDRIITFKDGHILSDEKVPQPRNAKKELEEWPADEEFADEVAVAK